MRPTNLRTLMESSTTTITLSGPTASTASIGMLPAATALEPGAKIRAAPAGATWWRCSAAVGCNRGAGEKFYAAQIFAEILDYDFVFSEDVFDDDPLRAAGDFHDDHAIVAVDWLDWRQA